MAESHSTPSVPADYNGLFGGKFESIHSDMETEVLGPFPQFKDLRIVEEETNPKLTGKCDQNPCMADIRW